MPNFRINLIGAYAYGSTGGIQAVNRFFIKELVGIGVLRKAFLLWDDPALSSEEGQSMHRAGFVDFFGLNKIRFLYKTVLHSIRYPRDLWVCTHINYALLGLFLVGWRRKNVVLFIYAAELDEGCTKSKLFALRRFIRVISISEYTKKKAVALGVRPENVRVMYIGVPDPFPNWAPEDRSGAAPRVLFVGRMDERYKGQTELLDAMLLLRDRFPSLRLVFVGGGKTLDDWRLEARNRGIAQSTDFLGRVTDEALTEEYRKATVFVMLSENEGFGLVYTEAMAHGVPCIGGDRDASREVIENGVTGFCVPAGNSTALADAISSLLKSPEVAMRLGIAGRQRFLTHFAAELYSRRFVKEINIWQSATEADSQ
jgi:phosphatidylinositol alpha-1,6-mannosyltransferase